jgi:hypothetical protein
VKDIFDDVEDMSEIYGPLTVYEGKFKIGRYYQSNQVEIKVWSPAACAQIISQVNATDFYFSILNDQNETILSNITSRIISRNLYDTELML